MNLETYRRKHAELLAEEAAKFRSLCHACLQPELNCYCSQIEKFDSKINFVILIHPIEVKRRIATGRMSHLCLEKSHLIMGQDYSQDLRVNQILDDPQAHSAILYPGPTSTNLTPLAPNERAQLFPEDKQLYVFVIDGTWNTARKMIRLSQNLHSLQRISFVPPTPSSFRVRKQPREGCYSTLEAIHHTIELIGESRGFDVAARRHDNLLHVFDTMVEQQLEYIREAHKTQTMSRHRSGHGSAQKPQPLPGKKSA